MSGSTPPLSSFIQLLLQLVVVLLVVAPLTLVQSQPEFFQLPSYLPPPYPWVKHVYLVYQTHMDVGFTNYSKNVCEAYFYQNYPYVLETAKTLKYMNTTERLIYTTHPWMLLEFLDGTARCTNTSRTPQQIKQVEDAINEGTIIWHAKPFTMLAEIADAQLFEEGIKLSRILDERYNKTKKITAAHKDVPGISRSAIPILARQGVKAIHIGVNAACVPPALPSVFRWRYMGNEVLTLLYGARVGYGYGGNITLANSEIAMVYNFTLDNSEPQTIETMLEQTALLKQQYPNAEFHVGGLDDFVNPFLNEAAYASLPIYEGEMGNTWLYGTGADPFRVSTFREIRRTMLQFEKSTGKPLTGIDNIMRRLMNIPEHNWGLTMGYLDSDHYSTFWNNKLFHQHRNDDQYQLLERAWKEKRSYLQDIPAILLKSDNPLHHQLSDLISQNLKRLVPSLPNLQLYNRQAVRTGVTYSTRFFDFQVDSTGSISYLLQKTSSTNYTWADTNHTIAKFIYQTFSYEDYHNFNRVYNNRCIVFVCGDFGKVGMNNTYNVHADWEPKLLDIFQKDYPDRTEFLLSLLIDPFANEVFGAPAQVYVSLVFPNTSPRLDITLKWFEKTATRLPEAMWLKFNPIVPHPDLWAMDVMGSPVYPHEVVINGSRHLHSIWDGISYEDSISNISLIIQSLDANLVAPGDTDHLLNFDGENLPDTSMGMHFNLFNNLWGTAFNQWYDDNALFRFSLHFGLT